MSDYIVSTTSGRVQGHLRDGRLEFLGIPYAEPPVGELRFKRAKPIAPWDGVFDAKEYGPAPVQLDGGKLLGSEDCLTVNIKRPPEGENLPVFVYIYGGGYNTGSACDVLYQGNAFAEDGILFASFQYRLNVLGFFDFTTYPGCEDFESNCGLSDQILALNWIHDNAAAFGGDPNRITICGESAGGASVVNMLAAPGVQGCFQQAIAESALPNCVMTHEMARRDVDLFLEGMGWTEADLPKLRTIDPYELQKGVTYMSRLHQYRNPGIFLPCPVQDDLLPVRPIDAIRKGSGKGVKLIIGTNRHEGTMFVHPMDTGFPNTWAMVAEMFEKNDNAEALPAVIAYYHPSSRDKFLEFRAQEQFSQSALPDVKSGYRTAGGDPFIEFATDYAFQMPAIKVADGQKLYTDDVWMYRYELVTKSGEATGWKATHAAELPFMFAVREHEFSSFILDGEDDALFRTVSGEIHGAWVRFIKTGDPGWERYTGHKSPVRIFDRETRTEQLNRRMLMQVWDDYRFYED